MKARTTSPADIALADTLFRVPRTPGIVPLQRRGPGGAALVSSWRVVLDAGSTADFTRPEEESILVVESGRGRLDAGGHSFGVARRGIFEEPATALYLPPGSTLRVHAEAAFEATIVSAPSDPGSSVHLVTPEGVRRVPRGRGHYAREVHDIFVRDPHPRRLLVGETFNPPGHWSSFPPHKHDGRDGEPYLEEIYVYALDPPQGFAQQMLYTGDSEAVVHSVRSGDAVLLPYGYHPVCVPPGYRLRYLWALAGDARRLSLYEDPAHRFIHDLEDQ